MTKEQLEFRELISELKLHEAVVHLERKRRNPRQAIVAASPERFVVAMNCTVAQENVSFASYALMVAVAREEKPPALAVLAARLGYSYHAVHKMLERTPFFVKIYADLVRIELNQEGRDKLERISKRLERIIRS